MHVCRYVDMLNVRKYIINTVDSFALSLIPGETVHLSTRIHLKTMSILSLIPGDLTNANEQWNIFTFWIQVLTSLELR